jgi:hypothetical protein
MKYWLESLQENAFDVFIVTIVIVSIIAYHYLQRWFIHKELKEVKEMLMEIYDDIN